MTSGSWRSASRGASRSRRRPGAATTASRCSSCPAATGIRAPGMRCGAASCARVRSERTVSRQLLADLYGEAIRTVDPRRVMPQHTRAAGGEWRFERAGRRVTIAKPAAAPGARLRVIAEINALRKRLSALKGGRLGARLAARGASVVTLAVSDVEGDDPAVIGSGPTVPDASGAVDLREMLDRRGLWSTMPPSVRARLEADLAAEFAAAATPFVTVATLDDALAALVAAGERAGLRVVSLGRSLYGEVAMHASQLAAQLRGLRGGGPALLVAGGEPVLRVTGDGLGGRAQELALRVALEIAGVAGITLLAAGTDGIDGPTTAAGGFADGGTVARAMAAGTDPRKALTRNDSHPALSSAGDLFVTGPTGTNVADVVVAWVDGR
ncbi:MAG: DUF4147 domain-containing protein [Gammaproteobacteria bacterium]|nr:DUF4147 domain-containing protein [Gammaproteobacteria bacterium]